MMAWTMGLRGPRVTIFAAASVCTYSTESVTELIRPGRMSTVALAAATLTDRTDTCRVPGCTPFARKRPVESVRTSMVPSMTMRPSTTAVGLSRHAYGSTIASASISTNMAWSISARTSTMDVAGRMFLKNSPCALPTASQSRAIWTT